MSLEKILKDLNRKDLISLFKKNDVNLCTFLTLSSDELKEIVPSFGKRLPLVRYIEFIKDKYSHDRAIDKLNNTKKRGKKRKRKLKDKRKKKRRKKDGFKFKQVPTAYLLFYSTKVQGLIDTGNFKEHGAIQKEVGKQWRETSKDDKKLYYDQEKIVKDYCDKVKKDYDEYKESV